MDYGKCHYRQVMPSSGHRPLAVSPLTAIPRDLITNWLDDTQLQCLQEIRSSNTFRGYPALIVARDSQLESLQQIASSSTCRGYPALIFARDTQLESLQGIPSSNACRGFPAPVLAGDTQRQWFKGKPCSNACKGYSAPKFARDIQLQRYPASIKFRPRPSELNWVRRKVRLDCL